MQNIQNERLTFDDLESLIDWWLIENDDLLGVFKNQGEEVFKNSFKVQENEENLAAVGQRFCFLNHMNKQLDYDLFNADKLVNKFEDVMVQLQNIVNMMQDKNPVDVPREKIFGLSEQINVCLNSCEEDVELLIKDLKNDEESQNPVEKVTSIMSILLKNLDNLETKMEQMKFHIKWIHNECKRIISGKSQKPVC